MDELEEVIVEAIPTTMRVEHYEIGRLPTGGNGAQPLGVREGG
jgi:hypothetical protein